MHFNKEWHQFEAHQAPIWAQLFDSYNLYASYCPAKYFSTKRVSGAAFSVTVCNVNPKCERGVCLGHYCKICCDLWTADFIVKHFTWAFCSSACVCACVFLSLHLAFNIWSQICQQQQRTHFSSLHYLFIFLLVWAFVLISMCGQILLKCCSCKVWQQFSQSSQIQRVFLGIRIHFRG